MSVPHWTDARINTAKKILGKYPVDRFRDALQDISEALGVEVTSGALRAVFLRNEIGHPTSFCARSVKERSAHDESLSKLVKLVNKGPVDFESLCNKLDMSPSAAKRVIAAATAEGVSIHIEHDTIGIKSSEPIARVQQVGVPPVVGKRQKVAVISDTHLGSKYCLREQLKEFVHYAYSQGVREILHPGDVLDGQYRHGIYEVSHVGIEDQTQDLFDTLPRLPGLTYHGITGNHDFTFTESSGVEVGPFITNYFAQRGRHDFKFYGNRGAFLEVRGATIHLWHPRSGVAYAKSYGIQKQIEKYTVVKPHVVLAGHWHIFNYCTERGVHGIACPTFQGGGSAFGKSIGGSPAIGGLILSWDLTAHGTMRSFVLERRSYFEVEKPVQIENDVDGIRV